MVLILCLFAWIATFAGAEGEDRDPGQPLIERIVVTYAASGERDAEALAELAALNPESGEKWTRIMDLWEAPVTVNEKLPEDLPDILAGMGAQQQLADAGAVHGRAVADTLHRLHHLAGCGNDADIFHHGVLLNGQADGFPERAADLFHDGKRQGVYLQIGVDPVGDGAETKGQQIAGGIRFLPHVSPLHQGGQEA